MITTPANSTPIITRFAPSPTGYLHLGHLYAAIVAHNAAHPNSNYSSQCKRSLRTLTTECKPLNQFLIRFEDIDTTRTREKYYQASLDDLAYFNIAPDRPPIRQTDRLPAYATALKSLQALGVVYPCFCSRKQIAQELVELSNAPHTTQPAAQHYPQTCRHLSPAEISHHLAAGRTPSWRINTHKAHQLTGPLSFTDTIHGITRVDPHLLGDTILGRKDIATSYHIAVVIDDAFQHITHITRGDDLLPSTHLHRLLQALLHLPTPHYHHHPLINDLHGERLAKRHAPLSLHALRQQGKTPQQILAMLPSSELDFSKHFNKS